MTAPPASAGTSPAPVGSEGLADFYERGICEVCGSSNGETLYDVPFHHKPVRDFIVDYYSGRIDPDTLSRGRYRILRCPDCGFLWQGQVLTEPNLDKLYEVWIDSDESRAKALGRPLATRSRLAHQVALAVCLLDKQPKKIRGLDFGMGWGAWCDMARAFGLGVAGAELSAIRIAHARARGFEVIEDLFESDRSYDLINAEQVFEHVADPVSKLRRLTARLVPGGILRLSVPDAGPFPRRRTMEDWRPGKDALHPLEHVNGFDHQSLLLFAKSAGLRPIRARHFVAAHVVAGLRQGALNMHSATETLYGHFRGTAVWFKQSA